ncbi:terpene synthase family protein [Crossiella sp. NPDC003009]
MPDATTMLGLTGPGMGLTRMSAFAPPVNTEPVQPHGVHFGGGALPEFYLPYPAKTSPHLERARSFAADWTRRIGIGRCGVWTDHWADAQDFGLWAALSVPHAPVQAVELVAAWGVWASHYDDFIDDRFKRTRDLAGARSYVDRLMTFLPGKLSAMPAPADPVQAGLADLWTRMAPTLPPSGRAAYPGQLGEFLRGPLWEIHNVLLGRVPDPVDYLEMRRQTGGGMFAYGLAMAALGGDLPAAVREHRTMRALAEIFAEAPGIRNDVLSYDKEVRAGDTHNAVLITQQFLGCDRGRATAIVNDLLTERIKQFQRLAAVDVPRLARELELDAIDRAALTGVVDALRDWLAGDHVWQSGSPRYR